MLDALAARQIYRVVLHVVRRVSRPQFGALLREPPRNIVKPVSFQTVIYDKIDIRHYAAAVLQVRRLTLTVIVGLARLAELGMIRAQRRYHVVAPELLGIGQIVYERGQFLRRAADKTK